MCFQSLAPYIYSLIHFVFLSCQSNPDIRSLNNADQRNIDLDTSRIERFEINCSIRAIHPVSDQECWFAGSNGMWGYTRNGGQEWIIDSIQHPDQPNMQFRSIAVTKEATYLLSIGSPTLLYRSPDMGKTWTMVYQENDSLAFYDAMMFRDDKIGFAMGDPTAGCISVIKTVDGGHNWVKIPCVTLPPTKAGEAAFAASNSNIDIVDNNVWIVSGGQRSRVFHSSDLGESWKVYDTPIIQGGTMTGAFSMDFFDAHHGILIGGDWENKEMNRSNKAVTKDGGQTWLLVSDGQDPGYQSCVQYLGSKEEILSVGIPGISFSKDGGQTWKSVSKEPYYTFRNAQNLIWLAGPNKIARWPIQ
ncbi:MAG: oxidoreductase [Bacteroidia bacterium]|nr:oxidoreductase [Bacteroidia bacterium]